MDKIFNTNRFLKYLNRYLILNSNIFIFSSIFVAIYTLCILLVDAFVYNGVIFPTETLYILLVMLVVAPCFFVSNMNKNNIFCEFTLPVTAFEKFITNFLNYVIILPTFCLLISSLSIQLFFLIPHENVITMKESFDYTLLVNWSIFYIVLAVQSIYWVGACYFQRSPLISTSSFLFLTALVIYMFIMIFSLYSLIDNFGINPFFFNEDFSLKILENYSISENMIDYDSFVDKFNSLKIFDTFFRTLFIILIPLGMWIVSYFKIRETEI